MTDAVESVLDAHFTDYTVIDRIHDVPPHEVCMVVVDDQRGVVKRNVGRTGRAGIEGAVIDFVGEYTSAPVPEIFVRGEDFFVARWEEEAPSPDTETTVDTTWAEAAGRCLARLHNQTAPSVDSYGMFELDGVELSIDTHADWYEGACSFVRHYEPTLERYGHGDMATAVLKSFTEHPAIFDDVGEPVCCHGWATPEHVTVHDGNVTCMVDFEHAIAAPGEFDFWRTVFPTFGSLDNDAPQAAFRAGYESVRPLPDGFERRRPLYELLNCVYFFESLYVQAQHTPAEEEAYATRLRTNIEELIAGFE